MEKDPGFQGAFTLSAMALFSKMIHNLNRKKKSLPNERHISEYTRL